MDSNQARPGDGVTGSAASSDYRSPEPERRSVKVRVREKVPNEPPRVPAPSAASDPPAYESCPDCGAAAWGNATCATCRSHWPGGDPAVAT